MAKITDWNENWSYGKKEWSLIDPGTPQEGTPVTLPHTWYTDEAPYQGEGFYQKSFSFEPEERQRVFLRFHGVDKLCRVYLNGRELGGHKGGYTIFSLELTGALLPGENLLTVLVSNETGKEISPLSGDFAMFGGIHRKTELILTGSGCFDRTWYGTEGIVMDTGLSPSGEGIVYAECRLLGCEEVSIRYTLRDPKGEVLAVTEMPAEKNRSPVLTLPSPLLWNGAAEPNLYTVKAELMEKGMVIDEAEQRIGFRSFSLDPEKGFFLNGTHKKLHGVAKHQDTAEVFSAATEQHWKEDMELIREIGANTVRLSHYPHPQRVYELCDEMGLLVWAEIPLLKLTENPELFENAKQQLTEMILQNRHHPSIFFWGLQNEIAIYGEKAYMLDRMKELNELSHALDPLRLSASANLNSVEPESPLNRITDVTAYNVYYGWYYGEFRDTEEFLTHFHRVNPSVPLGISEYGADTNTAYHSESPRVNDYTEEFQALYHETVYPYFAARDYVWGSYVWNMFDFTAPHRTSGNIRGRNTKGLVTHDRKTKKDSFYYYKAVWSREPFVHIAEKRFRNRSSEQMNLKVYSNQREVRVLLGEKEYRLESDTGVFLFPALPLSPGENEVTAYAGELRDTAVFVRCRESDPSYVYVDQNPGFHVENWFESELEEEKLFPEGYCSIRESIGSLLEQEAPRSVIHRLMPKIAKELPDTMQTFTLDKFFSYMHPELDEEEIKKLNSELIKIKKL